MSPSLTPDDRARLLGPVGLCATCRAARVRHYCRQCDQFFETCACDRHPHDGHRVYLWTADGVEAIPDFDRLFE